MIVAVVVVDTAATVAAASAEVDVKLDSTSRNVYMSYQL